MNNIIEQPTGIRAFGWGFLGFIGSNLVINITCAIGMAPVSALMSHDEIWGLLAFGVIAGSIWLALVFRAHRLYFATKTGVTVSIWWNSIFFALALILGIAQQ